MLKSSHFVGKSGLLLPILSRSAWHWYYDDSNGLPYGGSSREAEVQGMQMASIFMSYAGPVFPLTLSETENDIIVDRNISYDFLCPMKAYVFGAQMWKTAILSLILPQKKNCKCHISFCRKLQELQKVLPTILVDGQQLSGKNYMQGYSGDFTGVYGADNPNGSENILPLDGWEGYKALMEDGSYKNAFSPYPRSSSKVTVYTFTDFEAPEEYDAATEAISFAIDPDKTTIMQYGFEGRSTEKMVSAGSSYFVPDNEQWRRKTKLLIVLGDDIGDYTLQGYKDGSCEEGNEAGWCICHCHTIRTDSV